MHGQPDLNLASSYVPACLCILKCTCAFLLFVFSPVRGWIGLCCLLMVDRLLWNAAGVSSSILDVNAVAVALVGGLMVAHTRVDGLHTVVCLAVVGVWALVSALQVVGLIRMRRSYEIMLGACAVTVLSCLYQAPERPEWLALRAFGFVVANVALPYLAVLMQQTDIDTYANACRTLLILLGDLEVACGWVVVYILCIGYQMRGSHPTRSAKLHDDDRFSSVVVLTSKTSSPMSPRQASAPPAQVSASDEAALLREALASRRGMNPSGA